MKNANYLRKSIASVLSCALLLSSLTVPAAENAGGDTAGFCTAAAADEKAALPERYDPRQEEPEILTKVKTQTTPICWAYATLGAIESCLIKKGYADNTLDLAESALIWFSIGQDSPTDPDDPRFGGGKNLGKEAYHTGSRPLQTVACLASWQGVIPQCEVKDITTRPVIDESFRYASVAHLQNADFFKSSDRSAIKSGILETGPMTISYFHNTNDPLSSKAGYYLGENAEKEIDEGKIEGGWHEAVIIGWDDGYAKENFKIEAPGDGAWIVKNSYGSFRNSEDGYFYMSYYEKTINEIVSFDMEPATNYGSVHNYNCSELNKIFFTEKDCGLLTANVFEAKEPETVTAVGFYTCSARNECTVSLYALNPGAKDPADGTLVTEVTETFAHEGFHTVKLPQSYHAEAGQKYAAVVKYPIGSKQPVYFDTGCNRKGVSFHSFYSAEGQRAWSDCYGVPHRGDVAIHVYTEYEGEETDTFIHSYEGTNIKAYSEPLIQDTLKRFDKDQNGYITQAEMNPVFDNLFDINCDRQSDSRDITLMKRALLGLQETGTEYNWYSADLNGNSVFDEEDLEIFISYTMQRPRG